MGFLLAVSTLSVSAVSASDHNPSSHDSSNHLEYRLSRLSQAIEKRAMETIQTSPIEGENVLVRGFANRSGGGGFANRGGGGGFANRSGGGGFVNRSPWRNGGSFYNRY